MRPLRQAGTRRFHSRPRSAVDCAYASHPPRADADSLGACWRRDRRRHLDAAAGCEPAARRVDRTRRHLQRGPRWSVLHAQRRDVRATVAPFLGGLVLGGFLSAVLGGGWSPTWRSGISIALRGWAMWQDRLDVRRRLFVGFGTRLANGCTSGHGIFSNSNQIEHRGVRCFMAGSIVTTQVLYRIVLG